MNSEIKKEVDKIMAVEGDGRGELLRAAFSYIEKKEGKEGAERIKKTLEELGYPLILEDIKSLKWYKKAYSVAVYFLCMRLFGWTEEDVYKMGESIPKAGLLIMFFRQYVSLQYVFNNSPAHWKKHVNFGKIVTMGLNEEEKRLAFRLEGYKFHPVADYYLRGYFTGMLKLCIKSDSIVVDQVKSVYKGDSYNQYVATWK